MLKRGFTLVETLVVLVIMGLLSAAVVLAWPAGGSLRADAAALAARARLAAEESILSGAAVGLDVTAAGYAFYRLRDGVWREIEGERAFRRQAWREGVVSTLRRDGLAARERRGAGAAGAPTVIFDPTGLAPVFSVTLAEAGARFVVAGSDRGVVGVREARDD